MNMESLLYEVINDDSLHAMRGMADDAVDAIVTDPPYGLGFMGKEWDSFGTDTRQPGDEHYLVPDNPYGRSGVRYGWNKDKSKLAKSNRAYQERMTKIFDEALRVSKPGAHLLCFGGTRTFHRLACAIEDAGWEIRDTIMWVYGSGFPKSMDVGKAIDKALGAERASFQNPLASKQTANNGVCHFSGRNGASEIRPFPVTDQAKEWDGWGTCLKPAWEPIIVARKPLDGTVAHNVMEYGTGAINIDGCRVGLDGGTRAVNFHGETGHVYGNGSHPKNDRQSIEKGRFPANLVHDGSQEVLKLMGDAQRFFYCAKASKRDRGEGNDHPTVKPTALMQWLVRLVSPPGGVVLDPFCGSGSTGVACAREGMRFIGVDSDPHYCDITRDRMQETG